jgi:hypothetical protein
MGSSQIRKPVQGQIADADLVPLEKARNRLASLWLIAAALIFITLVIQSLRLVYGTGVQEVWGWILPVTMPTLGMIVTVLGYTALDPSLSDSMVRRSFLGLAFWLSLVYLCLILLTILMQPLSPGKPLELMRMSNLWLGPFQGLVASAIGVLFVSKRQR